jgi:hypothetical protein
MTTVSAEARLTETVSVDASHVSINQLGDIDIDPPQWQLGAPEDNRPVTLP